MGLHENIVNDPTGQLNPYLHVPGFVGTSAQRIAYTSSYAPYLTPSVTWYESDTTNTYQYTTSSWSQFGASGGASTAITGLTSDGTATGPGNVPFTLATVNTNVGAFGTASSVGSFIVNAKGLTTSAQNLPIQIAESQVTNLTTDLAGKQSTGNYITAITGDLTATGPGSVAGTLATVNPDVGVFGSATQVAAFQVNAKGLTTSAWNVTIALPPSQITAGTAGQVLLNNATPVPVWTTLSQDSTINSSGQTTNTGIATYPITVHNDTNRIFRSQLPPTSTAFTVITTSAYFCFLGQVANSISPKFVEGMCTTTSGTKTQMEVGLFSTPNPPNKTAQIVTKLVAGTTNNFGVNTIFRNSTSFSASIPAGTYLWAGFRTSASVAPVIQSLCNDYNEGNALTAVAGASFAVASSYVTSIPSANAFTGQVVDLRATLD